MKVIVKESGFYAGTWFDAGPAAVDMNDRVARPFLPPYGHQLAPASETEADVKASTKQSGKKGG
jgi:hypothetical protein